MTTNANSEGPGASGKEAPLQNNFLRDIIAEDVRSKKFGDA